MSIDEVVELMRLEYLELPGQRLTVWQARRLWDLPEHLCREGFAILIRNRFLARTVDGFYFRRDVAPTFWSTGRAA
jgi:hypothetical protein